MVRFQFYSKLIKVTAYIVAVVSLMAIVGWIFHIPLLTQVLPGLPTMKFNTALCFLMLSFIIFCTQKQFCYQISNIITLLLFVLALVTFIQDLFALDFGIDQFVVCDTKGIASGNPTPGRMSMATALSFLLLVIAISSVRWGGRKWKKTGVIVAHLVMLLAFFAIITFVFHIPTLDKLTFISTMAIHTALAFFIAAIAISLLAPKYGLTPVFTAKQLGSVMIRRIVLQLNFVTIFCGYLILYAYRKGYIAADFAIVLALICFLGLAVTLLIIVANFINVLEKKRLATEEELNVANSYLNNTPDPMVVINKKGIIQTGNTLMFEVFGYDKATLEGMNIHRLIADRYREIYMARLQRFVANSEKTVKHKEHKEQKETSESAFMELYGLSIQGKEIPVELTLHSAFTRNGYIISVAFRDISRRVNAEHKLQTALEASIIGIWDYNLETNELVWDDIMYQLYGLQRDETMVSFNIWKSGLHPDDFERVNDLLQQAIEGKAQYETDFRVIWPDNSIHYIRAKGKVYYNEKGIAIKVLGTNWDVTTIKSYEASLVEAKQKAETASKFKSEFLANMSHEIRTPLNGVIGFTDLLLKTDLDTHQTQYLKNVNNSAHLLLDVINDILDFSKIEAGKLELHIETVDIFQLCQQTISIIKQLAENKGLEILLHISPDIPRFVFADPLRIRQILTNLLGNAIKFTEKGEIELKVVAEPLATDELQSCFKFEVRDTGIGIAEDKLDKIFGAFDQEDSSTTRKYGGTGLGLTISNKLLELMKSKLQVKSKLQQGSMFYFDLCLTHDTNQKPSTIKWHKPVGHVLVVDDNVSNRIILKEMLIKLGVEKLSLAANGIEALEYVQHHTDIDLLIIDYDMPYMNGVEVIAYIRETLHITSEITKIMLLHSSADDPKVHEAEKKYDINYQYVKPIYLEQLQQIWDESLITNINSKNETDNSDNAISAATVKNVSVLIAEDNPVNQFLAKEIIHQVLPGATLIIAETGIEAVKIYQSNTPDLILMDIQMPEMSGLDATKKIRELEIKTQRHIPIIALTARVLPGEIEDCKAAGMDDYLSKPVIFDKVKQLMEKYIVSKKTF
ncbi:response regulator [Zhouia sp. PK063]|uniref:response regulator n=1 Tax=Zhouia sp. PK063 TaxID=3373602 RepID=UPI0037A784A6